MSNGVAVLQVNRRTVLALGGLALVPVGAGAPRAGEPLFGGRRVLLMVDDLGCIYCAKWKREVEQGYRNSDEGRFAPLEIRQRTHADLNGIDRVIYTPTFLLLNDGREVGRILGYAGADWFWGEIEGIFAKAGFKPGPSTGLPQIEERRT